MAVATPVLEKRINTVMPEVEKAYSVSSFEQDAIHNANIKDNFARLMNPQNKAADALGRVQQAQQSVQPAAPSAVSSSANIIYSAQPIINAQPAVAPQPQIVAQPAVSNSPYLVKDARADAAIFRADSEINRARNATPIIPSAQVVDYTEEEEDENLRPTATTIQYKTAEKTLKEVRVENTSNSLSKKEKVIIGTFVGIVVMLFALIIINAAIISSLTADLSNLNNSLATLQSTAAQVQEQVEEASNPANVYEYAMQNGMVWDGGND
ncbi:MAG: hypothetical protein E7370_06020 [Clostridiales bacterium]|nr:hypothetical protein [Clostridiales bacterium]